MRKSKKNNWNTTLYTTFRYSKVGNQNITWKHYLQCQKIAFMLHHNFYPKPKIDIKDAEIPEETRQKLQTLQQNYDDIVSKHSSNFGLTYLEEMTIDTDPNLPLVMSKPYPLPLKHHNSYKKKLGILLEAGLIGRSMTICGTFCNSP